MPTFCRSSRVGVFLAIFLLAPCVHAEEDSRLTEALALKPDAEAGAKIWKLCAACHREDGFGRQQGEFPSIAGQHQDFIVKQLLDVQSKKRINPTMYPFTDMQTLGGLQGIVNIAAFTAALPSNPEPVTGPGTHLALGETLYASKCFICHGRDGQGNAELLYPRVTNQHYPYLVRELIWIRDKIRKNSDPVMVGLLQDLSDSDIRAIGDYLSRLR